jgi:hypothetical protein
MDDPRHDLLINRLAIKYQKPVNVIKKIVESQFEFVYDTTKELNFHDIHSQEEFNKLKTNFNIKYLFTITTNYKILQKVKEKANGKFKN